MIAVVSSDKKKKFLSSYERTDLSSAIGHLITGTDSKSILIDQGQLHIGGQASDSQPISDSPRYLKISQ